MVSICFYLCVLPYVLTSCNLIVTCSRFNPWHFGCISTCNLINLVSPLASAHELWISAHLMLFLLEYICTMCTNCSANFGISFENSFIICIIYTFRNILAIFFHIYI